MYMLAAFSPSWVIGKVVNKFGQVGYLVEANTDPNLDPILWATWT